MVTTFRACPEPPGLPQQEPPRTTRTRYEGKGSVPAAASTTVAQMAARKEQGGQHGQQRKKIFHGSLTCWRICLSVPVAGLAGTARSGVVPDAVDQQAGRKFAIQAVGFIQFRLQRGDPAQKFRCRRIRRGPKGVAFPGHEPVVRKAQRLMQALQVIGAGQLAPFPALHAPLGSTHETGEGQLAGRLILRKGPGREGFVNDVKTM